MTPEEFADSIVEALDIRDSNRANRLKETLRSRVDAICKQAIHDYLASVVPEGPVSAERLKEIVARHDNAVHWKTVYPFSEESSERRDLLAAHDHHRSLCARLLQDEQGEAFLAGLEQGRREKAKMLEMLRELEYDKGGLCRVCGKWKGVDHKKDCRLAALLKEATP